MTRIKTLILAAVFATLPAEAFAHAHLVSSDPEVGGTIASTNVLRITFSEGLELKLSKFEIEGANGPVAGISPSVDHGDPKAIVLKLTAPLPVGTYTVHWHAVSVDTHKTEGTYSFTVK